MEGQKYRGDALKTNVNCLNVYEIVWTILSHTKYPINNVSSRSKGHYPVQYIHRENFIL